MTLRNFRPPLRSSQTRYVSFASVVALALLLGVAIVAYLLPSARAQNQPSITPKKAEFVPGELLVRFRPGTASARTKARTSLSLSTSTGRTISIQVNHFGGSDLVDGLMLAQVAPDDAPAAIAALRARADVEYAEPNFIRYPDVVPNDTHYADLWGLKSVNGGTSAETAWNTTTGSSNVVVGIVDSGIDIQHRDLKDNIFVNTGEIAGNNIDDDGNGFIDDVNGWDFINHDRTVFDSASADAHGTHVAGTIGAQGNNAAGVVGVNWDVQLLPLKAISPNGGSDSTLLEAFNYAKALRQHGVNLRVLNNSYGAQHFSQSLLDAIKQLGDAGILFVAAAGNETLNNDLVPHFPASFDLPNVISVAASSEFGDLASFFSNRGPKTVHLAAPGTNILSTTPRGYSGEGLVAAYTEADGSTYSNFNGTSMATPHVSGAAALACAADPNISLARLRGVILSGVDSGVSSTITGGRLNANKVVQSALENDNTPPAVPANFRIASQNGRTVELRWTEAGDDGTTARASLDEIRFTDTVSGEQFRLNSVTTLDPGTERIVFASLPLRHPSGQLSLRTSDNAGNASTATIDITLSLDIADPYIVSVGPAAPLTAPNSGTIVGPKGDDVLAVNSTFLPFPINFFGFATNTVMTSSNGALYIPIPPDFGLPQGNVAGDFAVANKSNLEGLAMVAGMWADLRTDRNATDNVYMVQPDPDRVIFRWQGVTFGTETPINFEIELRRDGTIQTRYGSGNANLNPVIVGISAGDPDAYLVGSHSSEIGALSLGNAQTVTFAPRNPPPPPSSDLKVSVTANPNPVISGQTMSYNVQVQNLGPSTTFDLVMIDVLPAGTTFVSCTTAFIGATCTGPTVGQTGTVTGKLNTFNPPQGSSSITFTIVVNVTAAPGTQITNTASATSFRPDPNPANNSASAISFVVAESFFNSAKAISAGRTHTTSVRNDGTVWNWGTGDTGQLGDGNSGIGVRTVTPVQVGGLESVDTVADSNGFVYALKTDGTVWAWGSNNEGQLGDGTTTSRTHPVQVSGLTNVKGIDVGTFYGAAVKTDGTVWHWGASNALVADNFAVNTTPVQLAGIDNVAAIATGSGHLLMLKTDKTVWAVGVNSMGQLGDGTSTIRHTPVQVTGLTNVARIDAGAEFSLALKEDGTVWAWGLNFNGALGPNGGSTDFSPHPNPVQITGLPAGMTRIAAGEEFCLAIAPDGTVWGWGNNSRRQLGPGNDFGANPTPTQIPNFNNVVAVAGGRSHSVALKADGSVWCWGSNSEGECGNGSTAFELFTPVRVSGLETVSSPSLTPPGGGFTTVVNVTITCATPGAVIHYTMNGNEPTENDPVIASGGTVKLTFFTFFSARAWKPGLVPSGTSFATFNIGIPPPQLVFEENGPAVDQVSALDAALLVRDAFPVVNLANPFRNANDPNTRVIVFARNVELATGQTAANVGVILTNSNNVDQNLSAEALVAVPNTDLWQVIFRLPNSLPPGTYQVKIVSQGGVSNAGTIRSK